MRDIKLNRKKLEKSTAGRGLSMRPDTLNFIPAQAKLRPLRDQMIVEPLDVVYSKYLIVKSDTKPLRGIVKAIGPGTFPKLYNHPDKQKRSKMWDSTQFRPTEVKVGDVIHLGGLENGGYSFESFYWGDTVHIHCTEKDVAGIEVAA